jgi:hypothetical protein
MEDGCDGKALRCGAGERHQQVLEVKRTAVTKPFQTVPRGGARGGRAATDQSQQFHSGDHCIPGAYWHCSLALSPELSLIMPVN